MPKTWTKKDKRQMERIIVKTIHYFCYGRNNAQRNSFQTKDIYRVNPEITLPPQTLGRMFLMPLVKKEVLTATIKKRSHGGEYHRYFINFGENELEQALKKIG